MKQSLHMYTRVLLIGENSIILNENGEVTSFNDKNVEYPRYLKIDEVNYQLIVIVVYDKLFISYFSFFKFS